MVFSTVVTLPLLGCVVLLWLGWDELGIKGILTCLLICAALLLGCILLGVSLYVFIALLSFFDVVLLLVIFGHDIQIK